MAQPVSLIDSVKRVMNTKAICFLCAEISLWKGSTRFMAGQRVRLYVSIRVCVNLSQLVGA